MIAPSQIHAQIPFSQFYSYLHHAAIQQCEAINIPPFTLYLFNDSSLRLSSYATACQPMGHFDELKQPFKDLVSEFAKHRLVPKFEFLLEFVPQIFLTFPSTIFEEIAQTIILACTSDSFRTSPAFSSPHLAKEFTYSDCQITKVTASSPLTDIMDYLYVLQQNLYPTIPSLITETQAIQLFQKLRGDRFFLARTTWGEIGAVGTLNQPFEGLTELIITPAPGFVVRDYNIKQTLLEVMVQEAFKQGFQAVFTTTPRKAGPVFSEWLGFQPYATKMIYGVKSREEISFYSQVLKMIKE